MEIDKYLCLKFLCDWIINCYFLIVVSSCVVADFLTSAAAAECQCSCCRFI